MTITDRPVTRRDERLPGRRARGLTITVVVLVVALLGLGAWAVYDYVGERDTAVTGEIQVLLEDYTASWNDHDGDAFLALVTSDYTFDNGVMVIPVETQARAIETASDFTVENIGEGIMVGDGPWLVAQADHTTFGSTDQYGMSLLMVVEEGGILKIASHVWSPNL